MLDEQGLPIREENAKALMRSSRSGATAPARIEVILVTSRRNPRLKGDIFLAEPIDCWLVRRVILAAIKSYLPKELHDVEVFPKHRSCQSVLGAVGTGLGAGRRSRPVG